MNSKRRKELETKGWKFGGVEDFLGLTEEELEYIEVKITLSEMVKDYREKKGLTQIAAAEIFQPVLTQTKPGDGHVLQFGERLREGGFVCQVGDGNNRPLVCQPTSSGNPPAEMAQTHHSDSLAFKFHCRPMSGK